MRYAAVIVAIALIATTQGLAQTAIQRAQRDEIAMVAKGDRDMEDAFRKARASLDDFIALLRKPRPTITNLAVKVRVGDANGDEYFWVSRPTEKDGRFIGRLDNTPRIVKNVKEGQLISFKREEIFDWLYREDGKMLGNFTACALVKKEPPREAAAFKQRFKLTCDD